MKITINESQFRDAFYRTDRKENFSYHALGVLFAYFEEYEEDSGEEIELDAIAICCEYEETHYEDIIANHNELEEDATIEEVIDYLQNNTQYVGRVLDSLIFASF